MSRQSSDQLAKDGTILNGYDYNLQNWVVDGIIVAVGNASAYIGWQVRDVPGHEIRVSVPEYALAETAYGQTLPFSRPIRVF